MSDCLWPYGLYCPWNSPDQNTGVGSWSLLQGIFPTQGWNPGPPHCRWIVVNNCYSGPSLNLQQFVNSFGSNSLKLIFCSFLRFPRQEYWSGLPCPSPQDLSNPGEDAGLLTLLVDSLPTETLGKPFQFHCRFFFLNFRAVPRSISSEIHSVMSNSLRSPWTI